MGALDPVIEGLGWACEKKNELGRGPLAKGRPGSGGSGGDEAGACGSRPWTPRRRPEWTRDIALGAAGASPWSIGTSPALNQSESGGKVAVFRRKLRVLRSPNSPKREPIFRFRLLGRVPPAPNRMSVHLIAISSPFPLRFQLIWRKSRKTAIWGQFRAGGQPKGDKLGNDNFAPLGADGSKLG
ncbi:hypothetical protein CRG98_018486 [Punica granatum]|uniref:Uncharacterized protein n=1 Tax=Punica granatum TaxID=22663 RepID=A0A2I0K0D7_PUNGR|nr:hypothetical protein CRG98_018486 [Punica granatum]